MTTAAMHAPPPLVMHVIHHLRIGGMENGLVNLVNGMDPHAFRHAIVCVDDVDPAFAERISRRDVSVHALHRAPGRAVDARRGILRLCRALRPSIVHGRNLSGLDALLPSWLAGVPVRVHGEHGWDVDNLHGERWKPALLRRLHSPLVSRYVTVSRDLAGFLERRVGIAAHRITSICNGVDTARFTPGAPLPSLGLPPDFLADGVVRLGTIGRLQPVKDQATLLRAFASMLDGRADLRARARLVVVGDGPNAPALRTLAHQLGIDTLLWMPGATSDVPNWLRALDVFVLPSLNEGISNAILEALASGLPVLASAVGGNPELIDAGVTGEFFRPGDVDTLADAMAACVDDGVRRQRQAAAARCAALQRFSLQAMVDGYAVLYRGLLRGGAEEGIAPGRRP